MLAEPYQKYIDALKEPQITAALAARILTLIDLTSLSDTDTPESITALCDKALRAHTPVAAVCIYPQFVKTAAARLKNSSIKLATVANFPRGDAPLNTVLNVIKQAIADGAQEIDVVFPYEKYLQGATSEAKDFIQQCKTCCGAKVLLKVILETGAMSFDKISTAAGLAIEAGADFIKTSTGKINSGATLEAAAIILLTIQQNTSNKVIGFKASGGVRTLQQAAGYLALADHIMGAGWAAPATFRIGASQLFDAILALQP